MSKARELADIISAGSVLADGAVSLSEVSGGTNNGVVYVDNTGTTVNGVNLTFDGTTLTSNNITATGTVTIPDNAISGDKVEGGTINAVTINTLTAGQANFADNNKAIFGAGSDLEIYHDGFNSIIREGGTGTLRFQANGPYAEIMNGGATETMARFNNNGSVDLYHDNSLKLATTSTGIDVTGTVVADGLEIADATVNMYLMESDTTDLNTLLRSNGGNFTVQTITDNKITTTARLKIENATGDISFYEDTGTTAKFFWDASAESLGIGNATPTSKLVVGDNATTTTKPTVAITDATSGASITLRGQSPILSFDVTSAGVPKILMDGAGIEFKTGTLDAQGDVDLKIDSSGNLLVGKTSAGIANNGFEARADGLTQITRAGGIVASLNRKTSDGAILEFNKDGAPVGSIRSFVGDTIIGNAGTVGLRFDEGAGYIPWNMTTNAANDNSLDLGASSARFKNLYISGTAYINGITVGRGAGAVATNTAVGASAIAASATGTENTAVGSSALSVLTSGNDNTAVGRVALANNTTGGQNTAVGRYSLSLNTSGTSNTGIGTQALASNTASNNTAVGYQAGYSNTTAPSNTAVGYQALYSTTTGSDNVAVGLSALRSSVTGIQNTAVGQSAAYYTTVNGVNAFGAFALYSNTTGYLNSAFGGGSVGSYNAALFVNTTGSFNSAFGTPSLTANTTGSNNSGFGTLSLHANTTGGSNTAVGTSALQNNTTASNNTAVGYQAGYSNTTGAYNHFGGLQAGYSNQTGSAITAIGAQALYYNTVSNNTAVGQGAMISNTTGTGNVALGGGISGVNQGTLQANTTGNYNTALGQQALYSNTTASNNTAVGYQAGYSNTGGTGIVAVGWKALYGNTTGTNLVAVGGNALTSNTIGDRNVAVGYNSLDANSSGGSNTAVGDESLGLNTTGNYNTAVGTFALNSSTASNNTAVGYAALDANTTGTTNVAVGVNALGANTTANDNVAVGAGAMEDNTTGAQNTVVGRDALGSNTTATSNVAVGYQAGYTNTTGQYNTFVGTLAGNLTTGGNNQFIGNGAGRSVTTGGGNSIIGNYSGNQGGLDIRTSSNNIVLSNGDGTPYFWIDTYGNTHMGLSATVATPAYNSGGDPAHTIGNMSAYPSTTSRLNIQERVGNWITWANGSGGNNGVVSVNGAGVTYGSNSDYRLKEDVVPLTNALARVVALNPVTFKWLIDETLSEGFIAHEVQAVIPLAVKGEKDGVADDGSGRPHHQSLDVSMLIPTLTAAIQEQQAIIESLTARVSALEGN